MPQSAIGKRLVWILVLLAAAQVVILALRQGARLSPESRWLGVGDSLAGLQAADSLGRTSPLSGGQGTVLLVFHSQCGHGREVAPLWARWMGESPPGVRLVAVSSEPMDAARAFAGENGWEVELRTVTANRLGGLARALTSRTPWVFVLDEGGRIVAEGHGSRLRELTAVLDGGSGRDLGT